MRRVIATVAVPALVDLPPSGGIVVDSHTERQSLPLPQQAADILALRRSEATVTIHIWPAPNMLVNTRFFSDDDVEFDFDPTEPQGQHQLDLLCRLMRSLGRQLRTPVRMTPENGPQHPLIIYSPTDDQFTSTA
ncbi:hypothetical protein [Micromonospora chersina]|uniref:hypothetical protein n=1 Tax=Micromonospora chersina TaxID=47854 RepID=UPI003D8AF41F